LATGFRKLGLPWQYGTQRGSCNFRNGSTAFTDGFPGGLFGYALFADFCDDQTAIFDRQAGALVF
jgi:hypothetical protein